MAASVIFGTAASAYNVVDLPNSMTFSDALGIFDASDIASATICDLTRNIYKELSHEEVTDFFYSASDVTVWRKVNPTPFRGACVNFTSTNGAKISYYFDSGVQIGTYGTDNYICYMPAKDDAADLSYLLSDFYDSTEGVYGGTVWNVSTSRDFLKLPSDEWAVSEVQSAAAKSLVPYDFTNKYNNNITREELAVLLENAMVVAGNYANMDQYLSDRGIVYLSGVFDDCDGRNAAIDRLYALGIISGRTETSFEPDGAVSRQEAAAMMTRVADEFMYVGTNAGLSVTDAGDVDPWAEFYVTWVADKGIMQGDERGRFEPHGNLTVQQAIAMVGRLYDLITYWES